MNEREFDIRTVEIQLKIDQQFEDFLNEKLGNRRQDAVPTQGELGDYGGVEEPVAPQNPLIPAANSNIPQG